MLDFVQIRDYYLEVKALYLQDHFHLNLFFFSSQHRQQLWQEKYECEIKHFYFFSFLLKALFSAWDYSYSFFILVRKLVIDFENIFLLFFQKN